MGTRQIHSKDSEPCRHLMTVTRQEEVAKGPEFPTQTAHAILKLGSSYCVWSPVIQRSLSIQLSCPLELVVLMVIALFALASIRHRLAPSQTLLLTDTGLWPAIILGWQWGLIRVGLPVLSEKSIFSSNLRKGKLLSVGFFLIPMDYLPALTAFCA